MRSDLPGRNLDEEISVLIELRIEVPAVIEDGNSESLCSLVQGGKLLGIAHICLLKTLANSKQHSSVELLLIPLESRRNLLNVILAPHRDQSLLVAPQSFPVAVLCFQLVELYLQLVCHFDTSIAQVSKAGLIRFQCCTAMCHSPLFLLGLEILSQFRQVGCHFLGCLVLVKYATGIIVDFVAL